MTAGKSARLRHLPIDVHWVFRVIAGCVMRMAAGRAHYLNHIPRRAGVLRDGCGEKRLSRKDAKTAKENFFGALTGGVLLSRERGGCRFEHRRDLRTVKSCGEKQRLSRKDAKTAKKTFFGVLGRSRLLSRERGVRFEGIVGHVTRGRSAIRTLARSANGEKL